ncbi:MAG TPA: histidinol-phosphate transaminase [Candidatus Mediterraneibacter faecavium]|uniref:Histidinol-phosphate aminotransferase n=1 Tax=Candidatus Mediterraneibacter faecavium TaxID=2838668 RepID=A0A9D2TLP9_9FIRM|nr:histidinol-phosphate transaminase [Candidatus Mediterraneibacter faecavium]
MKIRDELLRNIRQVEPYVPGEQPQEQVVKLNTNENPYPPSPEVKKALASLDTDAFRLYPDPASSVLVKALADQYQVGEDQVFVGVGSDDVLSLCFLTFFNSDKPILFPDITYSFYKVWAQLYRIPYECPKLNEDFRIVKEDYYRENGGVIFPNPNAPTAVYEELDFIEDILEHNRDSIVIVDEAYVDFAGRSAIELIGRYDNLIVTQTFSKARSMAGMRIGYAIADPELIRCLNDVKYSFNSYTMSRAALVCGAAAVKDREYFEENVRKIIRTREWAKEELKSLGFVMTDSKANFIFARHPGYDAGTLFEELKAEHIYVRHWDEERIGQYLRITVGTDAEMKILFDFLKKAVHPTGC